MSVLVDTSIWSLALRRQAREAPAAQRRLIDEWKRLVVSGQACLAGPIRQEVLSGVRSDPAFRAVQERLGFFDHLAVHHDDYDQAAHFYNTLRSAGVAGSAVDLLLCAIASRCDIAIFTTDADFARYARHLPIRLYAPPRVSR
jgi:predicted nucleic acid-binding protein